MHPVRRLLRHVGLDVSRYRPHFEPDWRRQRLLERIRADVVLDVGANVGGFARAVRAAGYEGRIVSFEPVAATFAELERAASGDPRWEARRLALGAAAARATINVGGSSTTSSLLTVREPLTESDRWRVARTEEIEVERLDALGLSLERGFLKLDTQGTELDALAGAAGVIDRIHGLEIELAFAPFYEEQPSYVRLLDEVDRLGFRPVAISPGWIQPEDGEATFVDALFRRR